MPKKEFSVAQRIAIWHAWDKRCFYTGEPIRFRDLEVDHVLPVTLLKRAGELREIRERLALPADFEVESFWNLVPTHRYANRQKSSRLLSDSNLRYYLNLVRDKYPRVVQEYERFQRAGRSEHHLTHIATLVGEGQLTIDEVVTFIRSNVGPSRPSSDGPTVFTVGLGPEAFEEAVFYAPTCDAYEQALFDVLRSHLSGFVGETEASSRDGECLSVRFAVWHAPVDSVIAAIDSLEPKWDLLEIASFSEIYPGEDAADIYAAAVAAKHKQNIKDASDRVFGLARCPECGSSALRRSDALDERADERYFAIRCGDCGWSDWSQ